MSEGIWLNFHRDRRTAYAAWLAVVATAGFAHAGTIPQTVNVAAPQATNAADLAISWQPVTVDIYGQPKAISNYNVYCSANPRFVPDSARHTNLLVSTNATSFVHSNALATSTSLFYYVTAVGADGTESLVFTDLVYKVSSEIACAPDTNAFAWLSLPYEYQWTNATSLAGQLPDADKLYRFVDTNQSYAVWDCVASTGNNFRVAAGDALGVEVSTGTVLHVYGKHSWTNSFAWEHRTDRFNHHWISLPPNSAYSNASALALAVPDCTKVARFDAATAAYESWFHLAGAWLGTDFAIPPDEGVMVSISSNSMWSPALVYPNVSVSLTSSVGYLDLSKLSATSQVLYAGTPIAEYAWDYEGDGDFDNIETIPVPQIDHVLQTPGTVHPTLRVRNTQGFYALAHGTYTGISMALAFTNQAFRSGVGETGTVTYTVSHAGEFSAHVYDANSNLVCTLESGVWHDAGGIQLDWDGRDSNGDLVPPGAYYIVIEQVVNGQTLVYDTASLTRGQSVNQSITDIAIPDTFSLAEGGMFPIQFTLESPAMVTVSILDGGGSNIATVVSNDLRAAGTHYLSWDGRTANGEVIAENTAFSVAISAEGLGDNAMIVQAPAPVLSGLQTASRKFTPSENPYGTEGSGLTIEYTLDMTADVRLLIRDKKGAVLLNALEPGKTAGTHESVWPGMDGEGRFVAKGFYSVTATPQANGQDGNSDTVWAEAFY